MSCHPLRRTSVDCCGPQPRWLTRMPPLHLSCGRVEKSSLFRVVEERFFCMHACIRGCRTDESSPPPASSSHKTQCFVVPAQTFLFSLLLHDERGEMYSAASHRRSLFNPLPPETEVTALLNAFIALFSLPAAEGRFPGRESKARETAALLH